MAEKRHSLKDYQQTTRIFLPGAFLGQNHPIPMKPQVKQHVSQDIHDTSTLTCPILDTYNNAFHL